MFSIVFRGSFGSAGMKNATQQHPPALFDASEIARHVGPITMNEIAQFLFTYLSSDSLGLLSKRHLAWCAKHGPNHATSVQLARAISDAVDFPKTGVLPKVSSDTKLKEYPDFMEVENEPSFESQTSLGVMYRQSKEVWEIHSKWIETMEGRQTRVNPQFLIPGYQQYIDQAAEDYKYYSSNINTILLTYTLNDEYDIMTGCYPYMEEQLKNNDSVEISQIEFRDLVREMTRRFAADKLK